MSRVVFSKVMWAGRARVMVFALTMTVAALAASLLVLAVVTRSAEAAFLGDNGLIVFSSDRDRDALDIFTISPIDGTTDRLTTFSTGDNIDPAVSPDGSRIAFSRGGEIWVMMASGMNSNGTGATQITDTSTAKTQPTWSPDGSRIAYVANSFDVNPEEDDARSDLEIWSINADGSGLRRLTNNSVEQEFQPAWSPDGTQIAFADMARSDDIYVMNSDGSGAAINLTPNFLPAGCSPRCYQGIDRFPSWSPDGNQIAYANNGEGGDADVFTMDTNPASNDWVNLTPNPGEDTDPAWSPNGDEIVYQGTSSDPNSSTDRNIYTMDANGANPAPLDTDTAHDISPDWQPDPPTCDVSHPTDPNGDNTLTGDPAEDEVICGFGGNDTMTGQDGDILMGGDGNDTLMVPSGRATLNGGPGKDTASFADSATRTSASLISGFAQRLGTNPLEGVALVGVENLTGSGLNDVLEGSSAANKLVGGASADKLFGLGKSDTLNSRDGVRDTVDGGKGTDTCTTDRVEKLITRCE